MLKFIIRMQQAPHPRAIQARYSETVAREPIAEIRIVGAVTDASRR
jgi:hypothetical protein